MAAPQRILFVVPRLDIGGAETQMLHLVRWLRSEGSEVSVVSLLSGGGLEGEFRDTGAVCWSLHGKKGRLDPTLLLTLRRYVRRFSPSLVHAHVSDAVLAARLALTGVGLPVVDTVHTGGPPEKHIRLGYRATRHMPTHTVFVSDACRREYVHRGLVDPQRASVVPNCVPAVSGPKFPRWSSISGTGELRILFAGRLVPEKGVGTAIAALAHLCQASSRRIHLEIAGDGALRGAYEEEVRRLGVSAHVRFSGFVRPIERAFARADVVVVPSLREGFGLVAVEAVCAGLPVVCARFETLTEILPDRMLPSFNPGDSKGLSRAIQDLIGLPPEDVVNAVLSAQRFVAERFDQSCFLARHSEVYACAE